MHQGVILYVSSTSNSDAVNITYRNVKFQYDCHMIIKYKNRNSQRFHI